MVVSTINVLVAHEEGEIDVNNLMEMASIVRSIEEREPLMEAIAAKPEPVTT